MKYISLFFLCILSATSSAGCLDSIDSAQFINSKIRGLYINGSHSTTHFVIIDKATCAALGDTESLGLKTKSSYYLTFSETDKVMQSMLLMAYAKGETIRFRLGPVQNGYNTLSYVVTPHNAHTQ